MVYDFLVVGAGFAGSVAARELADRGRQILVIDRRPHIGGIAYDEYDRKGVLVHSYGPHIFHTNKEHVVQWLSRFTDWRFYEHRALALVDGKLYPFPINQTTINSLYGLNLDERGVEIFLERIRQPRDRIITSEDVVLNNVGYDLCEKFFRNYTRKQWGLDLAELSAGVAARIPIRTNTDDRYFTDTYQLMPADGYTRMFERILDHPNINVRLNEEFDLPKHASMANHIIYTGPIDAFFNYRFGRLPYRSMKFEHLHLADTSQYQPVGTINYPNDFSYIRITEFKHLTGQKHGGTSILREYPQAEGDPCYPIPRPENEHIYRQYEGLRRGTKKVTFVGRLAQYRYYNMDQVVDEVLNCMREL